MPINRAPFNALVDDDGTGLTGSVWNKAAIKTSILDPVDAALGILSYFNSTVTTDQPAFNPGTFTGDNLIDWRGAGLGFILYGMAQGVLGRRVTIENRTAAGAIYVAHNSASAATGNKFSNTSAAAVTPIGPGGSATWVYDGTYWAMVAHAQGGWIDITFNVTNFWAGVTAAMVPVNKYMLTGRALLWMLQITAAPAPAPTPYLYLITPVQTLAQGSVFMPTSYASDSTGITPAMLVPSGNAGMIAASKNVGGNWTGTLSLYFTAIGVTA